MLSLLSFSVPDMQIKTAGSGGVAKEQTKHRQKNANKTEIPENIRALSKSTEVRLEMKKEKIQIRNGRICICNLSITQKLAASLELQNTKYNRNIEPYSAKKAPGALGFKK